MFVRIYIHIYRIIVFLCLLQINYAKQDVSWFINKSILSDIKQITEKLLLYLSKHRLIFFPLKTYLQNQISLFL